MAGSFCSWGQGLDARIHRMFFEFRRMQAEIPAPSRRKWKDKQREEKEHVLTGSVFKALAHALFPWAAVLPLFVK